MNRSTPILQVLICTFGNDGISKVAEGIHPEIAGVEYLVSWQSCAENPTIPQELDRHDFKIIISNTKGLSRNRNIALDAATAKYCLISDDDVDYDADGLQKVIDVLENNRDICIATFKYSGKDIKVYPDYIFDLNKPPKNYSLSSIEIAFRREPVIKSGIRFDERYGVGAEFIAGEENLWIHYLLKNGLTGRFFPINIAFHNGESTGSRLASDPKLIECKGAVFTHLYPGTWILRMIRHALRCRKTGWKLGKMSYCRFWISGALKAKKCTNC